MSHETSPEYASYLEERFQGEAYGEAIFRVMAERCQDPEQVRKLRVMEQLERETKEFLRPAVREAGNSGEESADQVSGGEALGAKLAKVPWRVFMLGFEKELERFVAEFERAEALAPRGKESLLRHVTAHERALLEFVIREIRGDATGDALEPILAFLRA